MADAGTAYVDVQGKFDKLEEGLSGALAGIADRFSGLGAAALPVLGVVAGAALAAGGALFAIGDSFSKAYDTIRVNTGATGKLLDSLKGTFDSVVQDVPTSFGKAADAISILHDRLGLTGQPLRDLSDQVLELSRVMKTDLGQTATSVAQLMNNWGISAADQGPKLDELFRAAQRSGIGINDLMDAMSTAGPQLRTLGLNFEQSAGMVALLEKNGVSTGPVFMSLSHAIDTAVKSGQSAPQAFQDMISAIQAAPNPTAAAGLAITDFGARAGPKLAALIQEGKFSYQDFAATLSKGDTIRQAGQDTDHLGETFTMLKNKLMVEVKPAVDFVFNAINDGAKKLPGVISDVSAFIGPKLKAAFADVSSYVSKWWPDIETGFNHVVSFIKQVWPGIEKTLTDVFNRALPGIKAALSLLSDEISTVVNMVKAHWPEIEHVVQTVIADVEPILERLASTFSKTYEMIAAVTKPVLAILEWGWKEFGGIILSTLSGIFDAVSMVVDGVLDVINGILDVITGIFSGDWSKAWEGIKEIFSGVWEVIKGVLMFSWTFIKQTIEEGLKVLQIIWDAVWSAISGVVTGAWDLIKGAVSTGIKLVVDLFTYVPGKILDLLGSLPGDLLNLAVKAVQFLWNGWLSMQGWLFNQLGNFVSGILGGLGQLATDIYNLAANAIRSLWNGWVSMEAWLFGQIGSFVTGAITALGNLASDAVNIGVQVVQFLWNGWLSMWGWIGSQISGFVDTEITGLGRIASEAVNIGANVVRFLWNGIQSLVGWIGSQIDGFVTGAANVLGGLISDAYNAGVEIVKGLWNGWFSLVNWIIDKAKGFAGDVIHAVLNVFDMGSPSRVFYGIGQNVVIGFANGLDDQMSTLAGVGDKMLAATLPQLGGLGVDLIPGAGTLAPVGVAANVATAASLPGVASAAINMPASAVGGNEVNVGQIGPFETTADASEITTEVGWALRRLMP